MSNEVAAALVGAGVGIVLGGLVTWLIDRSNFNREKKAELNIRRKSRLYTPLRRSLMRFKIQLGEDRFPPDGFKVEPDDPELRIYNYQRGPDFSIWQEMKNDGREYHVPKKMRKQLDNFKSLLAEYNELQERFDKMVSKSWAPLGSAVTGRGDWKEGPFAGVTVGVLSNSVSKIIEFYLIGQGDIEQDKWEEAARTLLEKVGGDSDARRLRELVVKIRIQTTALIDLFSEEIERVVDTYEARKSRWGLRFSDQFRTKRKRD